MIDIFNIPNTSHNNQVFYSASSGATNQWQTWNKPKGCSFVYIIVIGGGGAGGSGISGQTSTSSGGAGGGSSSITKGFFSASALPDTLYIQVGAGGVPTINPSVAGGSGSLSYVSVKPNTTSINILLQSGASPATGGVGGGASSRTAGVGGTVFTSSILSILGLVESEAGQNGATGGPSNIGNPVTMSSILTGGASGGGTDTNIDFRGSLGGNIICSGFVSTISGGTANTSGASTGQTGNNYITLIPSSNLSSSLPFFSSGGSGGGSGLVAGRGGNGNYGSGGGGGGNTRSNAPNNVAAGLGGSGGNGIVIITCL